MVERWSSKPYAWVRFLLPLQHIMSRRFNPSQKNLSVKYFNLLKKNSPEHFKAYLSLASQLLHFQRNNPSKKVYFLKRWSKHRPGSAADSNHFFQKRILQYILTQSLPPTTPLFFFKTQHSSLTHFRVTGNSQTLHSISQFTNCTSISRQLMGKSRKWEKFLDNGTTLNNLGLSSLNSLKKKTSVVVKTLLPRSPTPPCS